MNNPKLTDAIYALLVEHKYITNEAMLHKISLILSCDDIEIKVEFL
jgi:hypothetical protein